MGTIIFSFFSIIAILLFIPAVLGQIPYCILKEKKAVVESWIKGFIFEVVIFALTFFIFVSIKSYNFRIHSMIYVCVLGILVLFVLVYELIINKGKYEKHKSLKEDINWKNRIGISIICILMLLIISNIILYKNSSLINIELNINSILQNNTIGNVDLYTGMPYINEEGINRDDMIIAFWAFLSWVSRIHPIILIEYILPLLFVFLFYGNCFMIGKELFKQDITKIILFILGILLLHGLGDQREWILFYQLQGPWTGEHIFVLLVLPVFILNLMKLGNVEGKRWCLYQLIISILSGTVLCEKGWFYITVCVILTLAVYVGRRIWK